MATSPATPDTRRPARNPYGLIALSLMRRQRKRPPWLKAKTG